MHGKPIQEVKNGLEALRSSLMVDPFALASVWISLISFGREASVLVPLTELLSFELPEITVPQTAPTNLGEGLELLAERYDQEVVKGTPTQKGDWLPILVVMTDGAPTDVGVYRQMTKQIKARYPFARVIACAAGPDASLPHLRELTEEVVALQRMDASSFAAFWTFVSDTIGRCSQTPNANANDLPEPPPEIRLF